MIINIMRKRYVSITKPPNDVRNGSSIAEALAVREEARRGWRRGQNLSALQAETNFGYRKSTACRSSKKKLIFAEVAEWQTR